MNLPEVSGVMGLRLTISLIFSPLIQNLISLNISINLTALNLNLDEQKYPYSWFAMGG